MKTESPQNATPLKFYDRSLLPTTRRSSMARWTIRGLVWLGVIALYVMILNRDVALMRWRYDILPEGPRGLFGQVLFGFRDFGQMLPIVVGMLIVLRLDRRRWTILPAILIAQLLASVGYNTGKLTIARYRPQAAIQQVATASPTSLPEAQKPTYTLSMMNVRQTWVGWRPGNRKAGTQSFPSGHSAAAFAFAGILTWFYPQLRVTLWLLAAGCAASRYLDAVHWLSDCVAGASIGFTAAWLSLRPHAWSIPLRLLSRKQR